MNVGCMINVGCMDMSVTRSSFYEFHPPPSPTKKQPQDSSITLSHRCHVCFKPGARSHQMILKLHRMGIGNYLAFTCYKTAATYTLHLMPSGLLALRSLQKTYLISNLIWLHLYVFQFSETSSRFNFPVHVVHIRHLAISIHWSSLYSNSKLQQ